jgi:7-carboxy-7-deazaguanine synthase
MNDLLRLTEIFYSLQGESNSSGWPTIFIRLTGCPLRCQYCDTTYAFHGGKKYSFTDVLETIKSYDCKKICITGGEPLVQKACIPFMTLLIEQGYQVSIETSGARDISGIHPGVTIVMDLKTPDSQEENKNLYQNLAYLKPKDQVKFVICSEKDYLWAKNIVQSQQIPQHVDILFSPSWGQVSPTALAEWILADQLNVRFQIQLHKILWEDGPGR